MTWRSLLEHRRGVLAAAALVAAALLPGLLRLGTDNSPEVFFLQGSAAVERYRAFRETFGGEALVRLVLEGDVWSDATLAWLAGAERRIAALPGVSAVSGPCSAGARPASPGTAERPCPPGDAGDLRRDLLASPLAHASGWIDDDGAVLTVAIALAAQAPGERRTLLDAIAAIIAPPPAGVAAHLVGLPVLNHALDDSAREIEELYFPLLVLFAVVLLAILVRDLRALAVPLLFVAFCELLVLAPMGYAGVELNMVLAVLPPLVFAIALATSLHVLLHLRRCGDVVATYRDKAWSLVGTGLTTVAGFASLAASPVGPVRRLGIWAALGLAAMTATALLVLPALLAAGLRTAEPSWFERRARRLGRQWAETALRRRRTVLGGAAVLAVIAAAGLPRIRVESNALRYLAPDHPARAGIEALEARGVGSAAVELVLARADPFAAAEIDRLQGLGFALEDVDGVLAVLSAADLADAAARRVPGAGDRLIAALTEKGQLARFLAADRRRARITVFVRTVGFGKLGPLQEQVRALAERDFPEASIEITGEYPLLLEAQRTLISTLAVSLGLTLLVVAVILRLLLPGTRMTLLALVPNLWPVLGMLGLMGWAGVPLDIATVMVASIVLGLAVDDSIHTLGHFRRLAPRHGPREAVVHTLETTVPAYLLTGLILIAGFGVCGLSDFAPTSRFGLLSAFAIFLGLIGDLFLLPALLGMTPASTVGRLEGVKLSGEP